MFCDRSQIPKLDRTEGKIQISIKFKQKLLGRPWQQCSPMGEIPIWSGDIPKTTTIAVT
jgi:hypothetical protein